MICKICETPLMCEELGLGHRLCDAAPTSNAARRWQWLATLKCHSFSLERDEHKASYMTATQWIEDCVNRFAGTAPEVLQAMKATDTIWSLQIYPDTPIGFYVWYGATAEACIDAAMEAYK